MRKAEASADRRGADSLGEQVDAFYDSLSALLRLYQYRDRDRSCCGGLTVTECHALEAVVGSEALSVTELAQALRLDKSSASRVVASLECQKLIERRPDPTNHRIARLVATSKGRSECATIVEDLKSEQRELLEKLSPDERVRFTELIQELHRLAERRTPLEGGRAHDAPSTQRGSRVAPSAKRS